MSGSSELLQVDRQEFGRVNVDGHEAVIKNAMRVVREGEPLMQFVVGLSGVGFIEYCTPDEASRADFQGMAEHAYARFQALQERKGGINGR